MADEKIVTSIVANSDFSGLIADVQRVTGSLSKLQQEFAGSNRALAGQINAANAMFNQTMLKTGQFSSHFVSLTSDVEKFGRNLDSGRLKLRDYFRVYQDHVRTHGGLIRDLAKQQVQLQNAVLQPLGRNAQGLMQYNVHIPRGLDLTKNKTSLLKQELQIMNKVIQDGGVQLINWGKNTQWAGRQLTVGLTLPLVAFGKAAADAFKVADQELTRLTKVYGDVAGTSAQELGRIRKEVATTARELSSAMGVNFAETISLAADIAATGKTGNELLASVSETTRLAVLGEVDRQEAMKATLAIQSAFKQNTDELAESINFLNAVENQTSTTLNDLVEAIPKAGPVIKGLGGDVQDLALYLTAMREGGINASEGANALKSALASLINPTDVAVAKFQGFGIDLLGIVNKNAGDVTATLFALQSALDKLDPLSKQQAIEQLFGKFQFSRLNALFENLGRQGSQTLQVLDLMSASASQLEAVAGRELAAVTESAAGRYKRATETLKAELAGVGDQFLDIATKLVNVLNKILEFGQKLPDPIKKIMAFGGAFTAIIGPVIMLTGVLANFFGYIIKGLGHFKALFKGAEGFRLLTPEIIAAKNASSMLSDEFYSDAKAADTLRMAIERLNEDLIGLQVNAGNATKATSGLGQVMMTSGGTPIMPVGGLGGYREVIPGHPLLGPESRAAAHLNPRNPNDPSTIFGLTLQPIPLNRKIGRTPQILMSERLPDIEGLTTAGGYSTGVVAGEHARYAALMATLGMQSRQEIEALKKTIGLGGQVSQEFIATFDDILPITQRLTANAAAQSAAIVADLRAGKINVEQARAAIIAANADLERMLGVEVSQYAALRGRTIDLTKAPLIDQPVVDVAGKPNTRGMFRKGIFKDVMESVGRATRTRTFGGPYSIETTRRLNKGGKVPGYINGEYVYTTDGMTVPGPNVNADVVPAVLTPGEFVLTRDTVAREGSDKVEALHRGEATIVPFEANSGGMVPGVQYKFAGGPILRILSALKRWDPSGVRSARKAATVSSRKFEPSDFTYGPTAYSQLEKRSSKFWGTGYLSRGRTSDNEVLAHVFSSDFRRKFKGVPTQGSAPVLTGEEILARFGTVPKSRKGADAALSNLYQVLPDNVVNVTKSFNSSLFAGSATAREWLASGRKPEHFVSLMSHLINSGVPEPVAYRVAARTLGRVNRAMENIARKERLHAVRTRLGKPSTPPKPLTEDTWGNIVNDASKREIDLLYESYQKGSTYAFNRGGRVPGYRGGRAIRRPYGYARGVQRRLLGGGILRMLAMFGLPMAGQSVGNRVGGAAGTAISTGSLIASMFMMPGMGGRFATPPTIQQRLNRNVVPQFTPAPTLEEALAGAPLGQMIQGTGALPGRKQSIFAGTRLAPQLEAMATSGGRASQVIAKLAAGLTRTNLALGLVAGTVYLGVKAWQNYQDSLERTRLASGLTEESAGKLGLKFKSLGSELKNSIGAYKMWAASNRAAYEGMTGANAPFKMTIAEYKKLRKEVKGTMQDQIDLINNTEEADLPQLAIQLKAMFMAAGMSADEAARKIYMAFSLSNKAGSAAAATVGNAGFNVIQDSASAATAAVETFNLTMDKTKDGQARLNALNTAWMGIINAIDDATEKAAKKAEKDGVDFNEQEFRLEEQKRLLDDLSKIQISPIGQNTLDLLAAADASILKFATKLDNVVSLQQKMALISDYGYGGDLTSFNPEQVAELYNQAYNISQKVERANRSGVLAGEYQELSALKTKAAELEKAAKGERARVQINRRDRIKALEDEIKKINEAADARKKALQQEAEDQDINLEIQKKRLEYEQRLAAGDMGGAAQSQLDLQQLITRQQRTLTEREIDTKTAADIAPLQAEIDSLNKAAQKMADNAALAADSLDALNKKIKDQEEGIAGFNKATTAYILNQKNNVGQINEIAAGLKEAGTSLNIAKDGLDDYVNKLRNAGVIGNISGISSELVTTPGTALRNRYITEITQTGGSKITTDTGEQLYTRSLLFDTKTKRWGIYTTSQMLKDPEFKTRYITYEDFQSGKIKRFYDGGKADSSGPISGAGTGTSDSIIARVSNGEFVTKAVSVSDVGVNNMHLINTKGAQGLIEAAQNIVGENKAMGGLIGYSMGGQIPSFAIGGIGRRLFGKFGEMLVKATSGIRGGIKNTFDSVMDSLGMGMKNPADAFPMDPQLAKQALEEAIDNATRNKMIVPQLPNNLQQAKYLTKMYKEHSKFWQKEAKKYKDNPQTVGQFNSNLKFAKEVFDSEPRIIDNNPMVKDWKDFVANVEPTDFSKPRSSLDKEFFDIVSNPVEGISGDRGFISKGLQTPDLFGGINAPETLSLYDYYLGKVSENKLIESVYRDITKIIASDPLLARKLGLINPKGMAYGGLVGYPMGGLIPYNKGGKVKKPNLLNRIDSALGGLANKENWEQTANFFALPEIGRSLQDVIRYGNPMNALLARLAGGEMRSSISDNLIAASFGIPVGKIPGVSKGLSWLGNKFANFGVAADQKLVSMFSKMSGSKPTIPTPVAPKAPKLGKLHKDFVRAHPQEKNFINYLLSKGVEPEEAARQLAMRRGGLDWRPRKNLFSSLSIWESPSPSAIARAEAKVAQDQAAFEDAMLLFPFAKGEKQFDRLGGIVGEMPKVPGSPAKGMIQDTPFSMVSKAVDAQISGAYVNPIMDILKKAGVSAEYDALVNYIIAREAKRGYGLTTRESIFESVSGAHIDQSLVKEISDIVSKRGFLDTSIFNPLKSAEDPSQLLRPTVGVHAALMRILQDPATGIKYFEKGSHPNLPLKSSYMEIFNELYGSRLAKYLGIPAPRNTLGFRGGDILSPVILSEDFGRLGLETVLDRFAAGASKGLFGTDESLTNIFKAGYVLPEPEILKAQLAEDVGRLAGFVSLIKSVDTFQNEGNMIMSKVGARLGALDFGFSWDKSAPFPDLFTKTSEMLKLKDNFKWLLNKASFGRAQYDAAGNPVTTAWNDLSAQSAVSDEEFLTNAYKGLTNVAERVGNVSNIKKIIDLVLRDMTEARPDLDLRLPLEMAEQMASLAKIFKDKSIGKLAGGGYINPTYMANMSIPSFNTGVNYLYDDTIAQLHQKEAVLTADQNPWNPTAKNPIGGNISINIPLTVNAAPGMDENALVNRAAVLVQEAATTALTKSGRTRAI